MNLLLCYYCFGRAAHARCLSHSAYPVPLRHGGRVNKPLTHEPRRIDNTPRHAASPFRDPFLSLADLSFSLPSLHRLFLVILFTGKMTCTAPLQVPASVFRIYLARNAAKYFRDAYRLLMTFLCTYVRLGSGARFERNTISMERGGPKRGERRTISMRERGRGRDIDARGSRLHLGTSSTSSLVEFTLDIRMRAACTHTRMHP